MVTSSDGLHDCHGNAAIAASIHTISHAGLPQCTYSFSHNSYFTFLHAFILLYFISNSPLVRFCHCHSHVPVYLSLSFCCSFHLPLFYLPLFLSLSMHLFSLHYFLCSVLSPSTVTISEVPPSFNHPASFI